MLHIYCPPTFGSPCISISSAQLLLSTLYSMPTKSFIVHHKLTMFAYMIFYGVTKDVYACECNGAKKCKLSSNHGCAGHNAIHGYCRLKDRKDPSQCPKPFVPFR